MEFLFASGDLGGVLHHTIPRTNSNGESELLLVTLSKPLRKSTQAEMAEA